MMFLYIIIQLVLVWTWNVCCLLPIICSNFVLQSCVMAEVVTWTLITETRVHSWIGSCENCAGHWHLDRLTSEYLVLPVRIILPMLHTHIHPNTTIVRKVGRWSLGTCRLYHTISDSVEHWMSACILFLCRIKVMLCTFRCWNFSWIWKGRCLTKL
jgi:hypothetical protein